MSTRNVQVCVYFKTVFFCISLSPLPSNCTFLHLKKKKKCLCCAFTLVFEDEIHMRNFTVSQNQNLPNELWGCQIYWVGLQPLQIIEVKSMRAKFCENLRDFLVIDKEDDHFNNSWHLCVYQDSIIFSPEDICWEQLRPGTLFLDAWTWHLR